MPASLAAKPALFLDRDGVIMDDVPYLSSVSGIKLKPLIEELMAFCVEKGFWVFVVTNQSGIARGKIKPQELSAIHKEVQKQLLQKNPNARFDEIYFCPHHPEAALEEYRQVCDCRKPKSGLLKMACEAFAVDLTKSIMVGDRDSDMAAGNGLGVDSYQIYENGSEHASSAQATKVFASVRELYEYLQKTL